MQINAETIATVKKATSIELVGDYEEQQYDTQLAEAIKNNTGAISVRIKDISTAVLRRLMFSLINHQNITIFTIDSLIQSTLPDLKNISRLKYIKKLIIRAHNTDSVKAILEGVKGSSSITELHIKNLNEKTAELFSFPKDSPLRKIVITMSFDDKAIKKLVTLNPTIIIEKDGVQIQNIHNEALPQINPLPQQLNTQDIANKSSTVVSNQQATLPNNTVSEKATKSGSNAKIINALKEDDEDFELNSDPQKKPLKRIRKKSDEDNDTQNPHPAKKPKDSSDQEIANTTQTTNLEPTQNTAEIDAIDLGKIELLKEIAIVHTKIRLFKDANYKIYKDLSSLQQSLRELQSHQYLENELRPMTQIHSTFLQTLPPEKMLNTTNQSSSNAVNGFGIPEDTFSLIESLKTASINEIKTKLATLGKEHKQLLVQNSEYKQLYQGTQEHLSTLSNMVAPKTN